jgi:hypothetical protein
MVFPAVYWRGMEPMMASAGQTVEAAAETAAVDSATSPSPWDDTTLSDVLPSRGGGSGEAVGDLGRRHQARSPPSCAGMDEATGGKLYDMVFSVNGARHHVHAVVASDGSVTVEQFTPNYEFSTQSLINEWHNTSQPCDVDGDGLVAPDRRVECNQRAERQGSYRLGGDRPLRAISTRSVGFRSAFDPVRIRFDTNGDSLLAPIDALIVINRLNTQAFGGGQAAGGVNSGGGRWRGRWRGRRLRGADRAVVVGRRFVAGLSGMDFRRGDGQWLFSVRSGLLVQATRLAASQRELPPRSKTRRCAMACSRLGMRPARLASASGLRTLQTAPRPTTAA